MRLDLLSPPLQQRLHDVLQPGETLLWAGQPDASRETKKGFRAWIVSIPLIGLAVYRTFNSHNAAKNGVDIIFEHLADICLLIAGLAGMTLPMWIHNTANWTFYAVTSERTITFEGRGTYTVRSFTASDLADVKFTEKDDWGDLLFRIDYEQDSEGSMLAMRRGFFTIRDACAVASLIASLAQRPNAGRFEAVEIKETPRRVNGGL